jgi:hypothetical protein
MKNGGIVPRILNLGIRQRWLMIFMLLPHYSLGKSPVIHRRIIWLSFRAGLSFVSLPGIDSQSPCHLFHGLGMILTLIGRMSNSILHVILLCLIHIIYTYIISCHILYHIHTISYIILYYTTLYYIMLCVMSYWECLTFVFPKLLISSGCFWALKIRDILEKQYRLECWNSQE